MFTSNQTRELVNKEAKNRLEKMENKTKEKYAAKEKTQNISIAIISFAILVGIGLFLLLAIGNDLAINIIGSLFIILGVLLCVVILIDLKKPIEVLALRVIKREIKPVILQKLTQDLIRNQFNDSNFVITKEIKIMSDEWWSSSKLLIDEENKKFVYQKSKNFSRIYNFSDIINYEVYENGNSKVKGTAGKALIGGAFFGLGGLLVGSSMGRTITNKCNQLELIIRVNDSDNPQLIIKYINNTSYNKEDADYKKIKSNIQEICSLLEFMINSKSLEKSTKESNTSDFDNIAKSHKEQLQELKEMFDDKLITQEEYELKKKQILGL